MKFKINYTINGANDYIIIGGERVEEISKQTNEQLEQRGLNIQENNVWSERI